jgi:hypothetical protein
MLRLAFDFIITWRETRTRPNAYEGSHILIKLKTYILWEDDNLPSSPYHKKTAASSIRNRKKRRVLLKNKKSISVSRILISVFFLLCHFHAIQLALWGTAFSNINTANGVIENGAEVGVNESLVSEARFFRAFDYFLLVQTFGGVPLDLGSGELKFNITPSRTSVRNTVPEVYTKAIFPDLLTAIENLPANPRVTGGVTKTVARLYLAKAYLTYAWWLKNPNNIPTYPECQRTDPDGHDAAWYFQQAYDVAVTAIENPGPFGLQESFWMVNAGPNDRNMEILLYADHTQEDEYYNGGSLSYGGGGAPDNFKQKKYALLRIT